MDPRGTRASPIKMRMSHKVAMQLTPECDKQQIHI